MNTCEAIQTYRGRGLCVIPLKPRSKEPAIAWKEYQERPPTDAQLETWFSNGKSANVGIVCGPVSAGLTVLDFDSPQAFGDFQQEWLEIRGRGLYEETPIAKTAKGFHIYLRVKESVSSRRLPNCEVKGKGNFVVAPPSVHPTGVPYMWENPEVEEILCVNDLSDVGIHLNRDSDSVKTPKGTGWVTKVLQGVPEGERDNSCIRLAGHYKAKGLGYEETLTLLKAWAGKCEPPFPDKEVEKCVSSAYGYLQREAQSHAEALERAKQTVLKWLKLNHSDAIDVALATVVANKAPGDPVWLLLVGAPSTGRTELLRGLGVCEAVHLLEGVTVSTFASGFERKDVGLLETLPDHTTLVIKEFGSILSMPRDDRAVIVQQLRGIYDGYYLKEYGNGKRVEWQGSMGLLAATTSAIENYHTVIGELGNRYILFRCELQDDDRQKVAKSAIRDQGKEEEMRKEIESAYRAVLERPLSAERITIPDAIQDKLASLADVVTQLRSTVSRDAYDKTVNYLPDIEGPARFAKATAKLMKGLAAVRGKQEATEAEYKIILKVAHDTIPRRRAVIVSYLRTQEIPRRTKEVASALGIPINTATLELEDLMLTRAVDREADIEAGDELKQTTPYKWKLRDRVKQVLEQCGLVEPLGESVVSH